MEDLIRVVVLYEDGVLKESTIPNTLDAFQNIVKGPITYTVPTKGMDIRNIHVICNDEGKLVGLKPNLALVYKHKLRDFLAGPLIFVSGIHSDVDESLSDEQVAYLTEIFSRREISVEMDNEVHLIKYLYTNK